MNAAEHSQEFGQPDIVRVLDPEGLARQALNTFISCAQQAITEKSVFWVALSGGHTPERFFQMIGDCDQAKELDWSKVHVFWVDERFVPPEADASNYGLAAHTFLGKVPIPDQNVHRMSGECSDYSTAVEQYENTIRSVFGIQEGEMPQFDLIVLGMGADGHIGSLFPNSYALFDTDDIVSVVYKMDGTLNRLTLTHPVLCNAKKLLILVQGAEKAEIVRDVLQNERDEVKYPVHTLWPILSKVTWVIDDEAGKHL
jgi:6-phosphogluconolactonase